MACLKDLVHKRGLCFPIDTFLLRNGGGGGEEENDILLLWMWLNRAFVLITGFDYKTCNVIQAIDLHNPDDDDNGYEGQENEEQPARDLVTFSRAWKKKKETYIQWAADWLCPMAKLPVVFFR